MKKRQLWSVFSVFTLFSAFTLLFTSSVSADVRMPQMFSDNCVLQRGVPVNIFGFADAGEKVTVEFNTQKVETTTDESGKWLVQLAAMETQNEGAPLTVTGKNTVTLKNVVVGEVWVCGGQSNMEFRLARVNTTEEEIASDLSAIRFFRDPFTLSTTLKDDHTSGDWVECKNQKQRNCTAVGFFFALRLHKELGCPIGLIDCNKGGSKVEEWLPESGMKFLSDETATHAREFVTRTNMEERKHIGCMYNAKMHPWTKYTIKGAIWYQGCSNGGQGEVYFQKMNAMIQAWRENWGSDFPFYWVQLANFRNASDDPNTVGSFVPVRVAQLKCLTIPKTGQAVAIDVGEAEDIHPTNKFTIGNRLAALALANNYGKGTLVTSPIFREMKVEGNRAILTFDNGGAKLVVGEQTGREFQLAQDARLNRFAVSGADGKFYWAEAKITSANTVEVTAPEVAEPIHVRYAFQDNPEGANLYNAEGFPASPFSTEELR